MQNQYVTRYQKKKKKKKKRKQNLDASDEKSKGNDH